MQRVPAPALLLATLMAASAAAFGVAFAAEEHFDVGALVRPSAPAGLLPPITIEGRKGWTCAAERAAVAATLPDAGLPHER